MPRRPTLKPGDICKLSKKARFTFRRIYRNHAFVVDRVMGDGSEGYSKMVCLVVVGRRLIERITLSRKDLWFTGKNNGMKHRTAAASPQQKPGKIIIPPQMNNEGQSNCLACGQPTTAILGITEIYTVCKNKGCTWYNR